MIRFDSIVINGFGSIQGPLLVPFKKRGLVIIRGENGEGKTTILSALVWCIYKTLIKKGSSVLTWEHKRPKDYRGTMVTVNFWKDDTPYRVVRCMDYTGKVEGVAGKNRVFLYRNGKLDDGKGVRDVNATLVSLMGMSSDLFCASVLFGQKMKRLIEEEGPKKKQVLEEAFEVTFVNKAQDIAKKDRDKLNKEYTTHYQKLIGLTATIVSKQESLESMKAMAQDFAERQELKIQAVKANLLKLKGSVVALQKSNELDTEELDIQIGELRDKMSINKAEQVLYKNSKSFYDKANLRRANLKTKLMALDEEQEHTSSVLEQKDALKCTKCGQYMPDETAHQILHEVTVDLNTKQVSLNMLNEAVLRHKKELASLSKLQEQYTILENKLNKILDTKTAANLIIKEIKGKQEQMASLRESIKELQDEKPEFNIEGLTEEIEALTSQQGPLTKICSKLARKLKLLDWMIATPLSNSGLKVFVFNQMIQKVNAKLKNYSSYIGFTPRFEVDLEGARKDINMVVYDGKYPIPFQDLSGGQSQMINVATAFAIHDIVSDGSINILFLDEVFESLSAKNVEIVGTIIGQKSRDKAIYLITHLQDFIAQTTDTLVVTRKNGGATQVG